MSNLNRGPVSVTPGDGWRSYGLCRSKPGLVGCDQRDD
jgi:hypothetical protein